ncbi:MAG: hypothetical protein MPN21_12780 [Thermoanaerobaculia bacterium]|nr:hypothetical protein [Thermoanaerobaculia bacterium]
MKTYYLTVGDQRVALPPGVTLARWSEERKHCQNPRIRAFLGCIQMLADVMESNYAILHCSPERLLEIWRKVREVTDLMLGELAPLLEIPSCLPALDDARATAKVALDMLAETEITVLRSLPVEVPADSMLEVRKQLCVSIGKLHNFLQDAFGELMAADPRSIHNADYFLSKRFPQDVEEAEWLHSTVNKLQVFLEDLHEERCRSLIPMLDYLRREQTLPTARTWEPCKQLLSILVDDLTPRLREILALRGIRFQEMETLDRYTATIPIHCSIILELYDNARHATDRVKSAAARASARPAIEQGVHDLVTVHEVVTARIVELACDVDTVLKDLISFVPLWIDAIEKRRALLLRRGPLNGEQQRAVHQILTQDETHDPDDEAVAESWAKRTGIYSWDDEEDEEESRDGSTPEAALRI